MTRAVCVSFPDAPYTHACALRAAHTLLGQKGWIVHDLSDFEGSTLPDGSDIYLASYDILPFESLLGSQSLCSSYFIRKALIRKHYFAQAIYAFCVKHPGRSVPVPRTWILDIQFADELDELLADDLFDVREALERNKDAESFTWFILKPGMADQANGIRLFSSVDQLQAIFAEFEDRSSDEGEGDDDDDKAVMTSQLRHFVIQEYIAKPLLLVPFGTSPLKFHLRVYVICVGGLSVYMHDDMLALFSNTAYDLPEGDVSDLSAHLTNTCYQHTADSEGANVAFLWRDLAGRSAYHYGPSGLVSFELEQAHCDAVRTSAAQTIGTTFEAVGREASFHWQMWPNSFEIFGVDLLVGFDAANAAFCTWLLEVNAVRVRSCVTDASDPTSHSAVQN